MRVSRATLASNGIEAKVMGDRPLTLEEATLLQDSDDHWFECNLQPDGRWGYRKLTPEEVVRESERRNASHNK